MRLHSFPTIDPDVKGHDTKRLHAASRGRLPSLGFATRPPYTARDPMSPRRTTWSPLHNRAHRRALVGLVCLAWCLWIPTPGMATSQPPVSLEVDLTPADQPVNGDSPSQMTLVIHVDAQGPSALEELVAIIRSPFLSTRLLPLEGETGSSQLAATLDLFPQEFSGLPEGRRLAPVTCVIAQRRGGHLITLASRTLSLRVPEAAPPAVTNSGATPMPAGETPLVEAPSADPVGVVDPPLEAIALVPARIKEHSLVPDTQTKPSPAYWRAVKARILQGVREQAADPAADRPRMAPTVHFRLFSNGAANAIRLDPASGDTAFDEALVQSVAKAQPFPPFPAGVSDAHLDVHLALPMVAGRGTDTTPSR